MELMFPKSKCRITHVLPSCMYQEISRIWKSRLDRQKDEQRDTWTDRHREDQGSQNTDTAFHCSRSTGVMPKNLQHSWTPLRLLSKRSLYDANAAVQPRLTGGGTQFAKRLVAWMQYDSLSPKP